MLELFWLFLIVVLGNYSLRIKNQVKSNCQYRQNDANISLKQNNLKERCATMKVIKQIALNMLFKNKAKMPIEYVHTHICIYNM